MQRFLRGLIESDIRVLSLSDDDMRRVVSLLEQYTDARLDFTDVAIVALAERHGITKVATFDRRDFSIVRPHHTAYFELLP
jgi:predicted nucleic acid-binding protein